MKTIKWIFVVLFLFSTALSIPRAASADGEWLRPHRPNGVTITFGDGGKAVYVPIVVGPVVVGLVIGS